MSDANATPAANAEAPNDWARPMLERQLAMLGRLAEDGMDIAHAIKTLITERPPSGADGDEVPPLADPIRLSIAYARVARAVRLTLLLQSKLIADLRAIDNTAQVAAARARSLADIKRPGLEDERKSRIERIVGRVALMEGEDVETARDRMRETGERLDHDEIYGDVLSQPVSVLVARICHDLGLQPDWPSLAQDAWVREEMQSGAVGPPLAGLMAERLDCRWRTGAAEPEPLRAHAASP